jgi:hypothetical protein
MHPGRQGGIATKAAQPVEQPNESELGAFARGRLVADHAKGDGKHTIYVERSLGAFVTAKHGAYQFVVLHLPS